MGKPAAIDDIEQLNKDARKAITAELAPTEAVKVVIPGNANDAIVATDRRALVFDWGLMSKKLTTYDYRNVTGIELSTGPMTGTITIQAAGVTRGTGTHGPNEMTVTRNGFDRAREGVTAIRHLIAESHAPAAAAPAAPDVADQLRKLGELRDSGILTPEEFDAKKAELLARM